MTLLPARDDEFETMINSLKIHPLLNGYRGSEAGDVPALLATLQSVSDFVMKRRESLVELEINPLLVSPEVRVCVPLTRYSNMREHHRLCLY